MNGTGFIVLWRKMITSWVWCLSDADFRLAVTCVCMANWKPGKWFDGKEMIQVPRGMFITSAKKLCAQLGKEATEKKVRNGLARLERAEFLQISTTKGKRYTVVTILNYSEYQDRGCKVVTDEGTEREQSGNRAVTDRAPIEQGNKETREQQRECAPAAGADLARSIADEVWQEQEDLRLSLRSELGLKSRVLPHTSPTKLELVHRVTEGLAGGQGHEEILADLHHVLAVLDAEARVKHTLRWLDGSHWAPKRFATALAMEVLPAELGGTGIDSEPVHPLETPLSELPGRQENDLF